MLLISVYIREYAWPAISSGVLNTPPTLLLILLSMLSLHLQQGENARQQSVHLCSCSHRAGARRRTERPVCVTPCNCYLLTTLCPAHAASHACAPGRAAASRAAHRPKHASCDARILLRHSENAYSEERALCTTSRHVATHCTAAPATAAAAAACVSHYSARTTAARANIVMECIEHALDGESMARRASRSADRARPGQPRNDGSCSA